MSAQPAAHRELGLTVFWPEATADFLEQGRIVVEEADLCLINSTVKMPL